MKCLRPGCKNAPNMIYHTRYFKNLQLCGSCGVRAPKAWSFDQFTGPVLKSMTPSATLPLTDLVVEELARELKIAIARYRAAELELYNLDMSIRRGEF